MDRSFKMFWIVWALCAALSLGFVGVIIWAIVRLIVRYT